MLKKITDFIKGNKKFTAAVSGMIVAACAKIGLDLDVEAVALIISPLVAYIIGQGWADTGKEAAKVEASKST